MSLRPETLRRRTTRSPRQPSRVPRPKASDGRVGDELAARPSGRRRGSPRPGRPRRAPCERPGAPPTSSAAKRRRAQPRAAPRRAARRAPATTAAAALEPLTVPKTRAAVGGGARLGGRQPDAGREQVGLDPAVERKPPRGERRGGRPRRAARSRRGDHDRWLRARSSSAARPSRGSAITGTPMLRVERRSRRARPGGRGGSRRPRRRRRQLGRPRPDRRRAGATRRAVGDRREPALEERRARAGAARTRARVRCAGAAAADERDEPVEQHAAARPGRPPAPASRSASGVGRADGERRQALRRGRRRSRRRGRPGRRSRPRRRRACPGAARRRPRARAGRR